MAEKISLLIRCPIQLAKASATLQFSEGATVKHEVTPRPDLAAGGHTRKESTRRDSIVHPVTFSSLENSDKNVAHMCM